MIWSLVVHAYITHNVTILLFFLNISLWLIRMIQETARKKLGDDMHRYGISTAYTLLDRTMMYVEHSIDIEDSN